MVGLQKCLFLQSVSLSRFFFSWNNGPLTSREWPLWGSTARWILLIGCFRLHSVVWTTVRAVHTPLLFCLTGMTVGTATRNSNTVMTEIIEIEIPYSWVQSGTSSFSLSNIWTEKKKEAGVKPMPSCSFSTHANLLRALRCVMFSSFSRWRRGLWYLENGAASSPPKAIFCTLWFWEI